MEAPDFKGKTVMLVEDDYSSRVYLSRLLIKTGAEVVESANGFDALNRITENNNISLVFMDLQMPGMDGFETARKIRESRKDIKIIAQTAYGLPEDIGMLRSSGFDDFLIKPIYEEDLYRMIQKYRDFI